MAVRVKHKVAVQIGLDTGMKDQLMALDDTLAQVILDGFDRARTNNFHVAAAASETLPLTDIADVRGLYLHVDADCEVRLDGEATGHQLKVPVTGGKAKLLIDGAITEVVVVATEAVNGVYAIWGDPTA